MPYKSPLASPLPTAGRSEGALVKLRGRAAFDEVGRRHLR